MHSSPARTACAPPLPRTIRPRLLLFSLLSLSLTTLNEPQTFPRLPRRFFWILFSLKKAGDPTNSEHLASSRSDWATTGGSKRSAWRLVVDDGRGRGLHERARWARRVALRPPVRVVRSIV